MKEPRRLLSHGATDFERQLLRAVVNEHGLAYRFELDGRPLSLAPPSDRAGGPAVLLYHKPVGEVVTHDDPQQPACAAPLPARTAASPYFFWMVSFRSASETPPLNNAFKSAPFSN